MQDLVDKAHRPGCAYAAVYSVPSKTATASALAADMAAFDQAATAQSDAPTAGRRERPEAACTREHLLQRKPTNVRSKNSSCTSACCAL